MSVTGTIAALQALHRAVPGVISAPDEYPGTLPTSELPCVLVYVGPGVTRWESHGGDFKTRERVLLCRWFIQGAAIGSTDEGMQHAIQMLDRALDLYEVTDELSNGVELIISEDDSQAIRDSGVRSNLIYGDPNVFFRGFEVSISVRERREG